jgi:hypothetical protein
MTLGVCMRPPVIWGYRTFVAAMTHTVLRKGLREIVLSIPVSRPRAAGRVQVALDLDDHMSRLQ